MEKAPAKLRCINIDWLEVYCIEPPTEPRPAEYYEQRGYTVKRRAYGTPQYKEMFTIIDEGRAVIEVRRVPLSVKSQGGVMEDGACHLRLTNYACYLRNSVSLMAEFILANNLLYRSLTRIDLALDFQRFDNGLEPLQFSKDFMAGQYQKINQCNLAAHGKDGWALRTWNSLKWGAPTSAVTTKLYDKTLELQEVKNKSYIKDIWHACGLDGEQHVWRVEFSIKPYSNFLVSDKEKVLVPRSLEAFHTKDRQFFQFVVFANHYFHFKHREYTREGNLRPKSRCADLQLFRFDGNEQFYHPEHLVIREDLGRTEKLLARRLYEMSRDKSIDGKVRRSCEDIALHMADRYIVLDYVRQLTELLEYNAKRHPNFTSDIAILNSIRDKYQFSEARAKRVNKKASYLLID